MEQRLTCFGRGGAIAAAWGDLDLALMWMKFVEICDEVGSSPEEVLEHGRQWFWMVTASPSSAPRRLVVALSRGPPAEGMDKTVSTVFSSALKPEGGAQDTAEWCGDDGTGARFGGGGKIHRGSSGVTFL
jgi:hypothetical protein